MERLQRDAAGAHFWKAFLSVALTHLDIVRLGSRVYLLDIVRLASRVSVSRLAHGVWPLPFCLAFCRFLSALLVRFRAQALGLSFGFRCA